VATFGSAGGSYECWSSSICVAILVRCLPAHLSKVLERSAGAISNALVKLVHAGEVVQTSDHPRRYAMR
jgi:hypothetical protein